MSYDLYFWRYADEEAHTPGKDRIYVEHMNAIAEGKPPDGVLPLPKDEIEKAIAANLKAAGWSRDGIFFDKGDAAIEMSLMDHCVSFSLRGRWSGDDANFLINILQDFDLSLFDPQTSERFAL